MIPSIKLPSAHKEEFAIIGCCLAGGIDTCIDAIEAVPVDAFKQPICREVFGLIETLTTQGKEVNSYTLARKWAETNTGGLPIEIINSQDEIPSPANLPYYVETVIEAHRKTRMAEACGIVLEKVGDPTVSADKLLGEVESVIFNQEVKSVSILEGKEAGKRMLADLERRFELKGKLSGIETGFWKLDELTDGLQRGEQTLIGARPSMGKTAIGLNIIHHACILNKVPTLFVSLEMSTEAVMRRLLADHAEIEMNELRAGSYTATVFDKITAFTVLMSKTPLAIVDGVSGLSSTQLCAAIRRHCRKNGTQLVVVDYLQKIKPAERHEKRTYEVAQVSGELKALAVQTKAAFLTLAQLNRESEKDKKPRPPRLSDLADSGQIERDADTIALIHRDRSDTTGRTDLIIAKQRDGETGLVSLNFNGKYCRFESATYAPQQPID